MLVVLPFFRHFTSTLSSAVGRDWVNDGHVREACRSRRLRLESTRSKIIWAGLSAHSPIPPSHTLHPQTTSMEFVQTTPIHRVLCADCGTPIVPNGANLCVACLRNTIDITEGIPKQSSVSFCRNCERFLSPPSTWTLARPESQELLAICLKKLKGLNKVRLTEAHFIWTEPHSKRLRVSMTIQKEVRYYMRRSHSAISCHVR